MKNFLVITFFLISSIYSLKAYSQAIDDTKVGGWYMYFWNTTFKEGPFGMQGDIQYRNWNLMGDLEQLMLRGGFTYSPRKADGVKFTLGYAYIPTGAYGESTVTTGENRIYQEALLPQKVGERFYILHRFRFEQRFVESQDFRTRGRYFFTFALPFNQADLNQGAIYLTGYNEIFINGQRDIGNGNTVEIFDRNRAYGAMGYSLSNNLRMQLGYMQQTTNTWNKGQIQVSFHHTF